MDASKRTPAFQYKWATCLRAIGSQFHSAESLTQALEHYKAALHLLEQDPPSPKAKRAKADDECAAAGNTSLHTNVLVGQALASIDLVCMPMFDVRIRPVAADRAAGRLGR